jgi:hypothetical protein
MVGYNVLPDSGRGRVLQKGSPTSEYSCCNAALNIGRSADRLYSSQSPSASIFPDIIQAGNVLKYHSSIDAFSFMLAFNCSKISPRTVAAKNLGFPVTAKMLSQVHATQQIVLSAAVPKKYVLMY